jgi:hypothetical protein
LDVAEASKTLEEVLLEKPGARRRVSSAARNEIRAAAARALGETGLPAAEEPLVRALKSPAPEVRLAAAEALGRVGTAAVVPSLREAAESSAERELKRAARQSVARIKARISGAEPGQLSLAGAGGEAGMLTLAEGKEAGALSFPAGAAGRLSLDEPEPPAECPPLPPKRADVRGG